MLWVLRFAVLPDFKVEAGFLLSATVSDAGDDFIGTYPIARFLVQGLIVAIETHITITVVNNDQ